MSAYLHQCRRITLKNHLCGENDRIDDRSIDVYIRRIRLVLSKNKIEEIIRTVRGVVIVSIPH